MRSARGALPLFPSVGFPGPRSRTRRASCPRTGLSTCPVGRGVDSLSRLRPGRGDGRSPVSVPRGVYLAGVEQSSAVRGWPPALAEVAAPEAFPCDPAVFPLQPLDDLPPREVGEVAECLAGYARPEVRAPSSQDPVELDQQDVQRLVRVHVPARGLDLSRDGTQCLLGRVGVDVVPVGASLAMALDAPSQEVKALVDVGDQGLLRRVAAPGP